MTALAPAPAPAPAPSATGTISRLTAWAKVVTHDLQKPAALVMGFLTAFGVTPAPEGRLAGTALFTGYAALVHVFETLMGTSSGNGA